MSLLVRKVGRILARKCDAALGRLHSLDAVLRPLAERPPELHLELTNACNARCVFCPYVKQRRGRALMGEEVFAKALADFRAESGGDVSFTPIVGDALIHPELLTWVRRAAACAEVDGIKLVTNALLVHRFGAAALVRSGLSEIVVSTAGFQDAMYRRVYRSSRYADMRRNVLALLAANEEAGRPVAITVALRADRPLADVLKDPDFQDVLAYQPRLDFTWSFTSAGGRVTREELPPGMRLRRCGPKSEPCVSTYNGPMVLADGTVLICSCVAAMDGETDLRVGNVLDQPLGDLWRSERARALRTAFGTRNLNATCAACDMYRDLELYRTREGRQRARDSRTRAAGQVVRRRRPVA